MRNDKCQRLAEGVDPSDARRAEKADHQAREAAAHAEAKDDRHLLGLLKRAWLESGGVYG